MAPARLCLTPWGRPLRTLGATAHHVSVAGPDGLRDLLALAERRKVARGVLCSAVTACALSCMNMVMKPESSFNFSMESHFLIALHGRKIRASGIGNPGFKSQLPHLLAETFKAIFLTPFYHLLSLSLVI